MLQRFETLFKDTYIGQNPTANRGKFLVLPLSFSRVSPDDATKSFNDYINAMVRDFSKRYCKSGHLEESIDINPSNCFDSLTNLFTTVKRSKQQVYLIVDEYDSFANAAMLNIDTSENDIGSKQYRHLIASKESLLRNFGNTVKDESTTGAIGRMFFTGITPMAFADALSGLNMVDDITHHPMFTSVVGFIRKDLDDALDKMGMTDKDQCERCLAKMESHFNGYRFRFGQKEGVYNPQACLRYLRSLIVTGEAPSPVLDPNIATPSDNMIHFLARHAQSDKAFEGQVTITWKQVLFGKVVRRLQPSFRSADLVMATKCESAIVSLAYYHGYLTHAKEPRVLDVSGSLVTLECPNQEIQRIILSTLSLESEQMFPVFNELLKAKEERDEASFARVFDEVLKLGCKWLSDVPLPQAILGLPGPK
ncbi:hypothetical protein EON65_39535 [archaeon]|nr:MAG: hypothetical protein EON65_39535 [archaeon]